MSKPRQTLSSLLQDAPAWARSHPKFRRNARRLRAWVARGIETPRDLIRAYDQLPSRSRDFALTLLGSAGGSSAVALLIRVWREDEPRRGLAAFNLAMLGGSRTYRFAKSTLRHALDTGDMSDGTLLLLWILAWTWDPQVPGVDDEEAPLMLVELLERRELGNPARSAAAYWLGDMLEGTDRRRRAWHRASEAILDALSDESANVRREAARAAGMMRLAQALPQLRAMSRSEGGRGRRGSVVREVTGALHAIRNGDWPEWWWNDEPAPQWRSSS